MDATSLLEGLAQGTTTSARLLDEHIARMEARNTSLNAIVATNLEAARARAAEADAARAEGTLWGPLHGLPMTIKDSFEVVGMPATSGAKALAHHVPDQNADAVERLIRAGAIVYGKTNLPVYAGEWQSFNPVYGVTSNPWDISRTPGGSSGGGAASVAADFSPLELGSDVGGSIRIPAHFCGVFGHKPTHGLIPLRGHIPGPPGSLSEPDLAVAGPLARSARDLALMLDILVGPATTETAWHLDLPAPKARALGEFRVGLWTSDPACPLESDVLSVLEPALDQLTDAGMQGKRGAPAELDLATISKLYVKQLAPLMATGLPDRVFNRLGTMRQVLKVTSLFRAPPSPLLPIYLEGAIQPHRSWLRLKEFRAKLQARMARWFETYDVLLTPVAPWAAFPHAHDGNVITRTIQVPSGQRPYVDHLYWIGLATALGLPATSVPVGRTDDGLPVSVQVIGPRFGDHTCLAFAAEVERVLGGFVAPPA
ncbi:MAG: amidase [Myxococcota bacterium]